MEDGTRSVKLDTSLTTKTATLFDTLSTDTLTIIVKEIVELPSLEVGDEPTPEMPDKLRRARFLAMLFAENSPFRAAAAMLVSSIKVEWPSAQLFMGPCRSTLHMGPEMFEGETKEMELGRIVFTACGPYVRSLLVTKVPELAENGKDFLEGLMAHVFQYCRNVEEIRFRDYRAPMRKWGTASAFFREYAANLRTIDWNGLEDVTGLPDLRLCKNVSRLRSRKLKTATLVSLLKACGSTLNELKIAILPAGDSVEVIEAIRNFCKKLSVIMIENLEDVIDIVGQESYSSLICSYGSQLEKARMDGLNLEHLVEVVNACTHLEVGVCWLRRQSVDWRHVHHLGPRIRNLSISADLLYGNVYLRALEQCSNLRLMHLAGYCHGERLQVTNEMIANVFQPSRFPRLDHLTIEEFWVTERNMALIASSTGNLKSVGFDPAGSESEASVFQVFADSNRHLKYIRIDPYFLREAPRSAESALESLSELVKIFRKCQVLELIISGLNEGEVKEGDLIHICNVLPCRDRGVYVKIDDVSYCYGDINWEWKYLFD